MPNATPIPCTSYQGRRGPAAGIPACSVHPWCCKAPEFLSGYGMQRDERLHVRFGAADADIPSSFRSRSDVTGMESPRIRVGQTGQRGEDECPACQLHHRVGQRGFHHPLQFTAADMP